MKRKKIAKTILTAIALFLFFSIITFYYITFPSISSFQTIRLFFYNLGKLSGLIGFLFLSSLIISGDTARFFDRFFGIDKIIKFQRKFALTTTVFVIFHPLFFVVSNNSRLNYLIPFNTSIPLAIGTISLYFYITIMISSLLYKRISYKTWQYLHILIYLLFLLSLYHAVNLGSDTKNFPVNAIFFILLTGVFIGGIYRTYYKIKRRKFKCYVKEIKWETADTFTLKIKTNEKMNFKPGQFCFLMINKNRLYARHPFTISSSPKEKTLNFTIKISGEFTKTASMLKQGEEVIVDGPFGVFTLDDNEKKDFVFIAGGVGITPFISMIKDKLEKASKQKVLLLYGSKTEKDIIFKKELDRINKKWFQKVYILSQENKKGFETGFIDEKIMKKYIKNFENSLFYICGPDEMKDSCLSILKKFGVKRKNIFFEDFFL